MVNISRKTSLIIFFVAGSIFIGIGIVSVIDSNIPRFVQISEIIKPNQSGIFTPDMNIGNIANIFYNESSASIVITDPLNQVIVNKTQNNKSFNETIKSDKDGKYKILITNTGNTDIDLNLGAFSKASSIAFSGQMMLIITGIVIIILGIRMRNQA
ncbi:MAG: hypothetical protein H0X50_03845 [Nitrosopumilus sp.]|nr:hypothetical protein [Nitrosopumilus sp.]